MILSELWTKHLVSVAFVIPSRDSPDVPWYLREGVTHRRVPKFWERERAGTLPGIHPVLIPEDLHFRKCPTCKNSWSFDCIELTSWKGVCTRWARAQPVLVSRIVQFLFTNLNTTWRENDQRLLQSNQRNQRSNVSVNRDVSPTLMSFWSTSDYWMGRLWHSRPSFKFL